MQTEGHLEQFTDMLCALATLAANAGEKTNFAATKYDELSVSTYQISVLGFYSELQRQLKHCCDALMTTKGLDVRVPLFQFQEVRCFALAKNMKIHHVCNKSEARASSCLNPIHTPSHQYHVPTAVATPLPTTYIGTDGQTFI